jgi:hypothetical protein
MRYERTEEETKAIEEWLAKGNKVTVFDPGVHTDPDDLVYTWGAKKKKKKPDAK